MISLKYLEEQDFKKIVDWNMNKPEEYLFQWAGRGYEYPITVEKIKNRFEAQKVNQENSDTYIYKILDDKEEMIGIIELFNVDRNNKSATIGRFLIGEESLRGKGLGKQALQSLVKIGFEHFLLDKLILRVFDFNKGAIKCYENAGFIIEDFIEKRKVFEDGRYWGCYSMSIKKHIG